ncbi:MAG: CoA pyrophosphatase [Selenomonadales bacterium]|nr:CoA pyrophosphatase [Selenomonadales bacterium]
MMKELAVVAEDRGVGLALAEDYFTAAVILPLVRTEDGLALLFEVRASTLRRQPNEICFPGGKVECGEDALGAALREGAEEIGWKKDTMTLVGALDYVITPSRARIYPFVVTVADWEKMRLSEGEVAEVFTVPVRFFLENEPNECEMELATRAGKGFPLDKIPFASEAYRTKRAYRVRWYEYGGRVIWGLTANILLAFMRAVKEGRIELPE